MRQIRVDEVFDPTENLCTIVDENEPFDRVVARLSGQRQLRCVVVVNSEYKLRGVITRQIILRWAQMKLRGGVDEPSSDVMGLVRLAYGSSAGAVARPTPGIKLSDSIERAIQVMMDTDLIDMPVVDDDNHVLGDLRLSEILSQMIDITEGGTEV